MNRRLGGRNATWAKRLPVLRAFRAAPGDVVEAGWMHQCFCGGVTAKRWRGAWWCIQCGRERTPLIVGVCGCQLCLIFEN